MKWGRKKPSSPASASASSRPSLISSVLPASWLTKFKRRSTNSGQEDAECKPNGKWNSVYTSPLRCAKEGGGGGRVGEQEEGLNGGDDDAFWRLSFREEAVGGNDGNGSVVRSVWYHNPCEDQDHPKFRKPSSSYRGCVDRREEEDVVPKFCDVVSEVRESRGLPREVEISTEAEEGIGEKAVEIRTPRLRIESCKKPRSRKQRRNSGDQKLLENVFQDKPGEGASQGGKVKREDYNLVGLDARTSGDDCAWDGEEESELIREEEDDELCDGEMSPDWRKLKEMKIEEIKQRKTLYISREAIEKQSPKQKVIRVKSYSPRLSETCKIRALEEMKRSRSRSAKKKKKRKEGSTLGLESFAVVKTSLDPQKDFRDSMMEMITEQGISQPEEFEELLACYLTLNCDEYHELIIKVFRQVWFDLNQTCHSSELENKKLLF